MMKRVMILVICAALGLSHAYAQFTVGAKAGLNVASIGNVTVYPSNPLPGDLKSWTLEYGYLPGAHVGGYARYAFSPLFSVQTELLYSQMGYKITVPTVDFGGHVYDNVTGRMRMHYLNLPVLFRLTVPGSGLFAEAYYWAVMDRYAQKTVNVSERLPVRVDPLLLSISPVWQDSVIAGRTGWPSRRTTCTNSRRQRRSSFRA